MDESKLKKERCVYLSLKRKALKLEIDNLRSEEADVKQAVRASKDKNNRDFKALKARLVFLRHRPKELIKEMHEAAAEKKQLISETSANETRTPDP